MSYWRKEPRKKALWTTTFPEQLQSNEPRPKKRIATRSKKKREQDKIYSVERQEFLTANPRCAVFPKKRSAEVHHRKGRSGSLYLDSSHWLAVSRDGHRWIHDNIAEARKRGWIEEGWNQS